VIRYQLGDAAATARARAAAAVGAVTSLAPVVFAVVLVRRIGWAPTGEFWAVVVALGALVVVRAAVAYATARRKLRALVVTVSDDDLRVESTRDGYTIDRARVARIVEVTGALGGLRVESEPDPRSGVVFVAHVPRGGEGYAEVRAHLEPWRPIERRGRRGPAVRVAIGVAVVAAIFFVPFLLEDFVVRSKLLAAGLVVGMWLAMRTALRGR
jgi:hypothetical protein